MGLIGIKKRNLMSLWKRPDVTLYGLIDLLVCHFVCFLFLVWLFYWSVCQRMFAVVFAFILEDCALPVSVCPPTQLAKMHFFKKLHLCLKPQLSSFLLSPPSSDSAEGSVCQSRYSCFEAGETNYHRLQKLSTPASSLKSPLPLTPPPPPPAGD